MKKRIISFVLIMVMVIGFMPTVAFAANTTEFAGGSGTEVDPYLIETKYHLDNVRNYLDAHFKMIADIEFTDADFEEGGDFYNNGQGFVPIGRDSYSKFTGTFDGDEHTIKNLYINILLGSSGAYTGLFGYNTGTIKNFGLVDNNVSATSSSHSAYVGGIVGYNSSGTIINCYNTGTVSTSSLSYTPYSGGIAGYSYKGTIENCYNTGTVLATSSGTINTSYSGGIVGYSDKDTIENCYNIGSVSASATSSSSDASAGGIAGDSSFSTIDNCYNVGSVSASVASSSSDASAGGISGTNSGAITNCYNTSEISSDKTVGGISGTNSGIITNCHNTSEVSGKYAGGIVGENTNTIEKCYNIGTVSASATSSSTCAGGIVGENTDIVEKCYNIGTVSATASSSYYAYASGIVGYNDKGTISNCYNTGKISSDNAAGGIAGKSSNKSNILNCYNTGSVSARTSSASTTLYAYAGGIAGINAGVIFICYNTGVVSATTSVSASSYSHYANAGGISGDNSNTIESCYNTGTVSTSAISLSDYARSGGISGNNSSTIINCYNVGTVSASALSSSNYAYIGGIVGYKYTGTITNSYYIDIISKGIGNGNDTATKCTTEQMKIESTYIGFDFENIWTMSGDDCYPYAELQNVKVISDHYFDNACDKDCACGYTREITHDYKDTYNAAGHFEECTVCGYIGDGAPHEFDNACDKTCDCGYTRITSHKYDNACDIDCNVCGARRVTEHKYNNACDKDCNVCGATRTITHTFGAYVYNKDATYEKDGTRTRTCSVCGKTETVVAEGTKKTLINTSIVFTDIPAKKWFKQYVDYSVTYGIFSGTSASTFSPNDNITRAQFVQVLANLEGVDTSNRNISSGFTDVPKGKWYTAAVTWAAKNGIVNGVGAGKFDPNANVTREQMCVMLVNYAKFKGITLKAVEAKENFADNNNISKWAKDAVYICQQADIVNGKGAGMFDPKGTGTRAEACVIFTKFHKDFVA